MEAIFAVLLVIEPLLLALATIGIFWFTRLTYNLYRDMQKKQQEQEEKFNDLLEALVIATILSGPSSTGAFGNAKTTFLQEYKGNTKIFSQD